MFYIFACWLNISLIWLKILTGLNYSILGYNCPNSSIIFKSMTSLTKLSKKFNCVSINFMICCCRSLMNMEKKLSRSIRQVLIGVRNSWDMVDVKFCRFSLMSTYFYKCSKVFIDLDLFSEEFVGYSLISIYCTDSQISIGYIFTDVHKSLNVV